MSRFNRLELTLGRVSDLLEFSERSLPEGMVLTLNVSQSTRTV